MTVSKVINAYGERSAEYIELFGTIDLASEADRTAVLAWARGVTGPIVDVGCGPGQWTHFLSEHDLTIEGVDPTPEFVAAAQRRCPGIRFRIGQAEHLDFTSESLGGILSWYSLIHSPDKRLPVTPRSRLISNKSSVVRRSRSSRYALPGAPRKIPSFSIWRATSAM